MIQRRSISFFFYSQRALSLGDRIRFKLGHLPKTRALSTWTKGGLSVFDALPMRGRSLSRFIGLWLCFGLGPRPWWVLGPPSLPVPRPPSLSRSTRCADLRSVKVPNPEDQSPAAGPQQRIRRPLTVLPGWANFNFQLRFLNPISARLLAQKLSKEPKKRRQCL